MRVKQRAARRRRLLGLVIGVLLVLGGLGFWQARARQAQSRAPFERFLAEVLVPSQRVAGTLRNATHPDPRYALDPLSPLGTERLHALEAENQRLRALLTLRETKARTAVIAEIIARDTTPGQGYLTLDKGRAEGIEPHMVVLTPEGVLGQVIEVYSHSARSKIMPLTDDASGIGAVTTRGRAFGVLKGGKGRTCRMVYIAGTADIRPGDTVITSGLSRIYPPGLLLGTVESVEADPALSSRIASVKPAANPAQAEFVLLVTYPSPPAGQ
jgi:hypothetical protein